MKKMLLTVLPLVLFSCNPFDENKVLEYADKLNDLVSKMEKYDNGTYDRDEIDEFIVEDIRDLGIDLVVKIAERQIRVILASLKKTIA